MSRMPSPGETGRGRSFHAAPPPMPLLARCRLKPVWHAFSEASDAFSEASDDLAKSESFKEGWRSTRAGEEAAVPEDASSGE